jgi:polyhydroxyalkanoate synthesis regulator phasin
MLEIPSFWAYNKGKSEKVVARMLKDVLKKSLALGFGLAVTSKEQLEKAVEELVKRGEMTKSESQEFLKELMKKGEGTSAELEALINRKINNMIDRLELVKKSEVERLEKRIEELEKRLNGGQ